MLAVLSGLIAAGLYGNIGEYTDCPYPKMTIAKPGQASKSSTTMS